MLADRYRIIRTLGEGGMGRVYLAEHVRMGRLSAVKVMTPDLAPTPDAISRFNVLKKMNKGTTTAQILEVASRAKAHGVIPEFSFVFGDPDNAEREIENTLGFIRRTHDDPRVPWLPRELKAKVDDFELVLKSRFPSVQDVRTAPWGRTLGSLLARRRWDAGDFANPVLPRTARRLAQRVPDDTQAYGHLRAPQRASARRLPA